MMKKLLALGLLAGVVGALVFVLRGDELPPLVTLERAYEDVDGRVTLEPVGSALEKELRAWREGNEAGAFAPAQTDDEVETGVATVRGIVSQEEGEAAVAGAEVWLQLKGRDEPLWTKTDGSGSFQFELEAPTHSYKLGVKANVNLTGEVRWMRESIAPGDVFSQDFELNEGGTLAGHVVNLDDKPVAGARVQVWCGTQYDSLKRDQADRVQTTGADGSFRIEHIGTDFFARADAPGHVCDWGLRGRMEPGQEGEGLRLVVAPEGAIEGRIIGYAGPLVGAKLSVPGPGDSSSDYVTGVRGILKYHAQIIREETDEGGRFRLEGLPQRPISLKVLSSNHDSLDESVLPTDPPAQFERQLEQGHGLRGSVYGPGGEPVQGVKLRAYSLSSGDSRRETDGEGSFAYFGFDVNEGWSVPGLALHHPGYAVQVHQPLEVGQGPDAGYLEFTLERGFELCGVVRTPEGTALEDARVFIEGERTINEDASYGHKPTWERAFDLHETLTDEAGRFSLGDLYAGDFVVSVFPPNEKRRHLRFRATSGAGALSIELNDTELDRIAFQGQVRDAVTGEPITEFRVTPMKAEWDGSWGGMGERIEVPDGRFRLAGFRETKLDLHFRARGYAQWEREFSGLEDGEHSLDVQLKPSISPTFHFLDAKGAKATSLHLSVLEDGERISIGVGPNYRSGEVYASDGSCVLYDLARSVVELVPNKDDRQWPLPLDLRFCEQAELTLSLTDDLAAASAPGVFLFVTDLTPAARELWRDASTSREVWAHLAATEGLAKAPQSAVEVSFLSSGQELAHARLERDDKEGLVATYDWGHTSLEVSGPFPLALLTQVSLHVDEIHVRAEGYRTQRLDPTSVLGKGPALIELQAE